MLEVFISANIVEASIVAYIPSADGYIPVVSKTHSLHIRLGKSILLAACT